MNQWQHPTEILQEASQQFENCYPANSPILSSFVSSTVLYHLSRCVRLTLSWDVCHLVSSAPCCRPAVSGQQSLLRDTGAVADVPEEQKEVRGHALLRASGRSPRCWHISCWSWWTSWFFCCRVRTYNFERAPRSIWVQFSMHSVPGRIVLCLPAWIQWSQFCSDNYVYTVYRCRLFCSCLFMCLTVDFFVAIISDCCCLTRTIGQRQKSVGKHWNLSGTSRLSSRKSVWNSCRSVYWSSVSGIMTSWRVMISWEPCVWDWAPPG